MASATQLPECGAGRRPCPRKRSRWGAGDRQGQSLIESCIVIGLMCLLFLGLFQVCQLVAAREFLCYAAARGVRARTVGFNDFMTWKTSRVGLIPNAGKMTTPQVNRNAANWSVANSPAMWNAWWKFLSETPASAQVKVELQRIPLYLGAESYDRLDAILAYDDWDTADIPTPVEDSSLQTVSLEIEQEYPLRVPMHRAFYAADTVTLKAKAEIENHYPLYME